MSLRLEAINRIFVRLTASYGREFTSKWEGQEIVPIKSLWSHELAAFDDKLHCIAWALENLTPKAPNLIEFKMLCRQAPQYQALRLDAPKADPSIVDAEMAKIARLAIKPNADAKVDYLAWAKRIQARHKSGELLTLYQIMKYQTALGIIKEAS